MTKPQRRSKPSTKTVAQHAGVSVSAVSQTLRGVGRISDETREKILASARELNYVRNRRAASFRTGEHHEVGLLVHNIGDTFYAEVTKGVNSYFEERGFLIYLLDAENELSRQARFLQAVMEGGVAGLIWCPAHDTPQDIVDQVHRSGMATVTFLNHVTHGRFDHVGTDSFSGARAAAAHLCELGHRNIAFLGGVEASETRQSRYEGYCAALSEANIPVKQEYTRIFQSDLAEGVRCTIEFMKQHPEVTAIVSMADTVAFGVMMGLRQLGLEPGTDVSVTGFNDVPEAAQWTPSLTTVSINAHEIGVQLARRVLERREDPDAELTIKLLPADLIVRGSTGPCPT